MHSPELLGHFRNPRNVGELPPPAVSVRVENPVCGDILVLSATVREDTFIDVAFQVRGCTASIAAGSATTCLLRGRTLSGAAALSAADIEAELGGLETASKHAARLCVDGVVALLARLREAAKSTDFGAA